MQMHEKLKLELIIERPAYRRAGRVLEDAGVTGYTVLPAMAGFGGTKRWTRGTDLSASSDMVMIVSIMDDTLVQRCCDDLAELLGQYIGVLNVSEVRVIRDDLF